MKLLIIEDEKALSEAIHSYLEQEGYLCECALDFPSAEEKVALYAYDCILLDITLPGGSGLELLNRIRQNNTKAGVIILSAKNSVEDKITGLDRGADDYISKPFNLSELNSRIKSLLRRRSLGPDPELSFENIHINTDAKTARVKDTELSLTKKEYELLLYLILNKNRIITKNSIAEHLWGDDMDMVDSYDFIYTHIKNLRKKLLAAGSPDYMKTVYGMGYKFSNS